MNWPHRDVLGDLEGVRRDPFVFRSQRGEASEAQKGRAGVLIERLDHKKYQSSILGVPPKGNIIFGEVGVPEEG